VTARVASVAFATAERNTPLTTPAQHAVSRRPIGGTARHHLRRTPDMKRPLVFTFLPAALCMALLYTVAPAARAQDEIVVTETVRASIFMNGGIGKDEEAYMRKAGKDFNLRIEFSERKDNEFLADVDLAITDLAGNPVFVLPGAGPIVNLNLPQGKYRVAASFRGKTETQLVAIPATGGRDLSFHWRGKPKIDPYDGKPIGGKAVPG
jgi:hypothetical protein